MARISEKIVYIFVFLLLIFAGCANQLPPGGGEIDRIPPAIIEVYPESGTLNYNENYIELTFSKYVDKRSFKDAIFISPALDKNPEVDWSGKTARIIFPSELKKNTTYVITIGTDVVDLHNRNRLAQAFNIDFSTGSKIDRRSITGKVYSDKPEGTMIFCYLYKDSILNLLKQKPDYLSQVGADGTFKLNGLSEGNYLIFPIKDEYRSPIYNADLDLIGIPSLIVNLKATDTLFNKLNFFLTKYDSIKPRIQNAIMTDQNHIVLTFSEIISDEYLKTQNFFMVDSTLNKKFPVLFSYKGGKPIESVLSFKDSLQEGNQIFLFADTLVDLAGNKTLKEFVSLNVSIKPDTIKPLIKTFKPQPNNEFVDFQNSIFQFKLNKGVDTNEVKAGIAFSDTLGHSVNFSVKFIDQAEFEIKAIDKLDANKNYLIAFNYNSFVDLNGNKLDSIYKYKFKTKNGLDFTGISGSVINYDNSKNIVLVLQSFDNSEKKYYQKLSSDGKFSFEKVDAGKYSLWCFYDKNNNMKYDLGSISPFEYSEIFFYYEKPVQLKPRWQVMDLQFDIK